ncbi:hypothetical protein [Maricaulis parjimensis]|uniref:hypothetical protein n=1 Tax=Maricaulis parjimensis TaxID=144023 RepID=UPI00193AC21C|nr:hypothetical protein [Maricaulis parjimensis]
MHRFVTLVILSGLMTGCAASGLVADEADRPDWVQDRLADGDRRDAPTVVPVTSLSPEEAHALDREALRLIQAREQLDEEANRLIREPGQSSADEFVNEGQARTTPPQDETGH